MAKICKLEGLTELKCSADKIFEIFASKAYLIPKICPEKINSIEVIEGDWATMGSIKLWKFVVADSESAKERIEAIDEKNNSITLKALEGDLLKLYKDFKATIEVTPKDEGSLLKLTVEYEKLNDDTPDPNMYLDFVAGFSKDIDAYLLKP